MWAEPSFSPVAESEQVAIQSIRPLESVSGRTSLLSWIATAAIAAFFTGG